MGVQPFLLSATLGGVLGQRLIRRLCPHCRRERAVTEAEAQALGVTPEQTIYEANGCSLCRDTGYQGRTAMPVNFVVDGSGGTLVDTDPHFIDTCRDASMETNNICLLNFSQQCGSRGNACSGQITYSWDLVADCADFVAGSLAICLSLLVRASSRSSPRGCRTRRCSLLPSVLHVFPSHTTSRIVFNIETNWPWASDSPCSFLPTLLGHPPGLPVELPSPPLVPFCSLGVDDGPLNLGLPGYHRALNDLFFHIHLNHQKTKGGFSRHRSRLESQAFLTH